MPAIDQAALRARRRLRGDRTGNARHAEQHHPHGCRQQAAGLCPPHAWPVMSGGAGMRRHSVESALLETVLQIMSFH
ncbi:hypothetical protein LL963_20175 [Xanthomonas campestris pv. esculenti]|nr:hypothetical protein [Xanthomonas campestris pv. esculenti]